MSKKEATQKGVSSEATELNEETNPVERIISEGDKRREEIAANAHRVREEAIAEAAAREGNEGEVLAEPAANEVTPTKEETPLETVQAQEETPPEPTPTPSPSNVVKIIVDGKEMEVPEDKIRDAGIRTLQKESAADQRLADASQIVHNAEREAARIISEAQQAVQEPSQLDVSGANEEELDSAVDRAIDAVFDGDRESAKAELRKLGVRRQQTTQSPQISADDVALQVENNLEMKQAQRDFVKDFPDIVASPRMVELANAETVKIRQEHPEWTPRMVIMEAGNRIQGEINTFRGDNKATENQQDLGAPSITGKADEEKLESKKTVTTPPVAHVRRQPVPEKKPKTRSEIIAEMRNTRAA